ncbi:MAG: hypothetical protein KBD29_02045 [Candidatus Magasanikbacteria bacterium]|nr:hypothetical protein [Candidatus Magasanikbacteria bacterium]
MKKVLMGFGVLIVAVILFLWWGSTVEAPQSDDAVAGNTTTEKYRQNFTSDKGNFSIYFEDTPGYSLGALTLENGDWFPTHTYQYQDAKNSVWQIFYTEYPVSADLETDPTNSMLATIKGTEKEMGGKIVSTTVTEYMGFPAVDYEIYLEAEKRLFKGRNILNGRKLYAVVFIHDEDEKVEYMNFFDSLLIK